MINIKYHLDPITFSYRTQSAFFTLSSSYSLAFTLSISLRICCLIVWLYFSISFILVATRFITSASLSLSFYNLLRCAYSSYSSYSLILILNFYCSSMRMLAIQKSRTRLISASSSSLYLLFNQFLYFRNRCSESYTLFTPNAIFCLYSNSMLLSLLYRFWMHSRSSVCTPDSVLLSVNLPLGRTCFRTASNIELHPSLEILKNEFSYSLENWLLDEPDYGANTDSVCRYLFAARQSKKRLAQSFFISPSSTGTSFLGWLACSFLIIFSLRWSLTVSTSSSSLPIVLYSSCLYRYCSFMVCVLTVQICNYIMMTNYCLINEENYSHQLKTMFLVRERNCLEGRLVRCWQDTTSDLSSSSGLFDEAASGTNPLIVDVRFFNILEA